MPASEDCVMQQSSKATPLPITTMSALSSNDWNRRTICFISNCEVMNNIIIMIIHQSRFIVF